MNKILTLMTGLGLGMLIYVSKKKSAPEPACEEVEKVIGASSPSVCEQANQSCQEVGRIGGPLARRVPPGIVQFRRLVDRFINPVSFRISLCALGVRILLRFRAAKGPAA